MRPVRPTTPGRAAPPRVRPPAWPALAERPRRARPGAGRAPLVAARGRSPAMCARRPPGNGQPPRRPPLSTCTRASARSRSTVISSAAAAESGATQQNADEPVTPPRDVAARYLGAGQHIGGQGRTFDDRGQLNRAHPVVGVEHPEQPEQLALGPQRHAPARHTCLARACSAPGSSPTAFARSNVLTTRATGGSTRRLRMVRTRVASTGPRVAHQTGLNGDPRPAPTYRGGLPADQLLPARPRARQVLARPTDTRARFPSWVQI